MRETNEKIVIYQTKDRETSIDVRLEGETVLHLFYSLRRMNVWLIL